MNTNKIVRTICYFSDNPSEQSVTKLREIEKKLSVDYKIKMYMVIK
jgi:hypothetical protein